MEKPRIFTADCPNPTKLLSRQTSPMEYFSGQALCLIKVEAKFGHHPIVAVDENGIPRTVSLSVE